MMNNNPGTGDGISFNAHFPAGYYIHKMFNSCKELFINIIMEFSAQGLKCYAYGEKKFEFVDIVLDKIPNYQFTPGMGDINQVARFVVNIKTLVTHLKTVSKQASLSFSKDADDSRLVIKAGCINDTQCSWISSISNTYTEYMSLPILNNKDPVCYVDLKEFKEKLIKPSTIKCGVVQISSYNNFMSLIARTDNSPDGYLASFGVTPSNMENAIPNTTLTFPAAMLKHIGKQSDMCRHGDCVGIFVESDKVDDYGTSTPAFIMFQTSICTYGAIKLYIATHSTCVPGM